MSLCSTARFALVALGIVAGATACKYPQAAAAGARARVDESAEHHETTAGVHGPTAVVYRGVNYAFPPGKSDYTDQQAAKIEEIILTDKAPLQSPSYQGLIDYLNTLEAPGYGSSTGGFGDQTSLGQITYISIQLPKKLAFRVITYWASRPNADYIYVDDFLINYPYPPAFELAGEGDELVYRDEKNHQVLRKINLRNRLPKS